MIRFLAFALLLVLCLAFAPVKASAQTVLLSNGNVVTVAQPAIVVPQAFAFVQPVQVVQQRAVKVRVKAAPVAAAPAVVVNNRGLFRRSQVIVNGGAAVTVNRGFRFR